MLILVITVLPLTPPARRGRRWILAVPLILIGAGLIGSGAYMIIRGAATGLGGYPFGGYSVIRGALEWTLAAAHLSVRRVRSAEPVRP